MRHLINLLILVSGLGLAGNAIAENVPAQPDAPVYAVLSLIGDRLDIVIRGAKTGTNLDPNEHQPLAITNAVFDNAAVSAAAEAVRSAVPKAEVAALNSRSLVLFEKQRALFAVSGEVMAMPEAIKSALQQQGANKLVLIGKRRDDAAFKFAEGVIDGMGKLEGLGFYLDGSMRTQTIDPKTGKRGDAGRGFIAPFAFIEVTLVDLPSCRVLGKKKMNGYFMASAGRAEQDIGEPWNALSSSEKVGLVNRLVEREVLAAVKEIVAGSLK